MGILKKAGDAKGLLRIVLPLVLAAGPSMVWGDGAQVHHQKGDFLLSPKLTFQHYCAPCHGTAGRGDGRYYVTGLIPKPADLKSKGAEGGGPLWDDDYLFRWISQGSAAMGKSNLCPPWGRTLPERHIRGIILHLKTLAREKE